MQRIRFGLDLDGERGWHARDALGESTLGPLGFLNVLETQLGLTRAVPSAAQRALQMRACLADATCNDFYACAQSCFGGSPANVLPCVQKCSPNPGTLETGLETCAVQSCAAACE